jgi:hypothetical protein
MKFNMIKANFKSIRCCHGSFQGHVALNFIVRITGFLDFVHHLLFKLEHIFQTQKSYCQSTQQYAVLNMMLDTAALFCEQF